MGQPASDYITALSPDQKTRPQQSRAPEKIFQKKKHKREEKEINQSQNGFW